MIRIALICTLGLLGLASLGAHAGVLTTIEYDSTYSSPDGDMGADSQTASSGGSSEFDNTTGDIAFEGSSIGLAVNQGRGQVDDDIARFSSASAVGGNGSATGSLAAEQLITYDGSGVGNATWRAQINPGGFGILANGEGEVLGVNSTAGFSATISLEDDSGAITELFSVMGEINSNGVDLFDNIFETSGLNATETLTVEEHTVNWGITEVDLDLGSFSTGETKRLLFEVNTYASSASTCALASFELCSLAFATFDDPPSGGYGSVMFFLVGDPGFTDVPEPSTVALLALGLAGLTLRRRFRRSA